MGLSLKALVFSRIVVNFGVIQGNGFIVNLLMVMRQLGTVYRIIIRKV